MQLQSSLTAPLLFPPPPSAPAQVLEDVKKARTDDLADIQPDLAGLKPKLV